DVWRRKIHREPLSFYEPGLPVDIRSREQWRRRIAPEIAERGIADLVEARRVFIGRTEDPERSADAGFARTAEYLAARGPRQAHAGSKVVVPHRGQALGNARITWENPPGRRTGA